MKKLLFIIVLAAAAILVAGCDGVYDAVTKTVGSDIPESGISEFVYTYSNINYNAFYQRYRFYREDGKYMFFHETRERKDDYGPTTEEDITASGEFELTEEEWDAFYGLIAGGTVKTPEDSAESGSSGPWTYLYYTRNGTERGEYTFENPGDILSFEEFCETLAESRG